MSATVVPNGPIDRRVLHEMSGADYGALISGLRFMGLVDDNRVATPAYHALIKAAKAGEATYKPALLEILNKSYKPVLGSLDPLNGTAAQLEKAFKDVGVTPGQMLTKTVRFYVKAMTFCGVDVSPHIAKASRPSTPTKNGEAKRTPRAKVKSDDPPADPKDNAVAQGFERLTIPGLPGAFVQYPTTLTEANCDLFEAMIGVLRTYVKGRVAKEKKP
jgi:hypothetical protein